MALSFSTTPYNILRFWENVKILSTRKMCVHNLICKLCKSIGNNIHIIYICSNLRNVISYVYYVISLQENGQFAMVIYVGNPLQMACLQQICNEKCFVTKRPLVIFAKDLLVSFAAFQRMTRFKSLTN